MWDDTAEFTENTIWKWSKLSCMYICTVLPYTTVCGLFEAYYCMKSGPEMNKKYWTPHSGHKIHIGRYSHDNIKPLAWKQGAH
jgi:hypothetical protein